MRFWVITLTLLLVTASAVALDRDAGQKSQKDVTSGDVKTSPETKVSKEKKSPEWPRPYKPTEEISVDSIVPFPTDI